MNYKSEQFRSMADRERDDVMEARFATAKIPAIQAAAALKQLHRENIERMKKPGPFGTYNCVL
ncbi:MAG: hypothetical protein JKX91_11095 [Rhizobiaceae bacterium]|nr:hypothetical protein [Rhizobiaceae bacterium]